MLDRSTVEQALEKFQDCSVVVLGDQMLDRYIWGRVNRISPEAPVPVVEVYEEAEKPGGAGNVVYNLTSLGCRVTPIGIIGDDLDGAALTDALALSGADIRGIVCVDNRPTTVKTRVIADDQHVVRFDNEETAEVSPEVEAAIEERLDVLMEGANAIILQDYNKGVMTRNIISGALRRAREKNMIVTVDPKFNNFFEYWGVTLFKPNRKEAERALGRPLRSRSDIDRASGELLARLQAEQVLITRGAEGMSLYRMGEQPLHIPAKNHQISDVSGAGDTVIATITAAQAVGMSPEESSKLATMAAGYVVGEVGVVPITPQALLAETGD